MSDYKLRKQKAYISRQDTRPVGVPLEEPLTRVLNPRTDKHPPGPEHALETHSQRSSFNQHISAPPGVQDTQEMPFCRMLPWYLGKFGQPETNKDVKKALQVFPLPLVTERVSRKIVLSIKRISY